MAKNKFITFEGIEGVGKSTNIAYCTKILDNHKLPWVRTREPGGTPVGEMIRKILLSEPEEKIVPQTEALLMYAARSQHIEHVIKPALKNGQWVICDRFFDATLAYQGCGRGLGMDKIKELNQWVLGDFAPDLTILLDTPAAIGLERIRQRKELDRFEKEKEAFFETIRQCYLDLAKTYPERYRVVDASKPLHEVQKSLADILLRNIPG